MDLSEHALPPEARSLLLDAGDFDGAFIDPAALTALLATLDDAGRTRLLARVGGKAAAATALLAFGGTAALASAGALPDAAQNGLSRAMARVGIHLPASDGAPRPTVPEPDEPAPPQPRTGPTSDTDAGHDEPAADPEANDHGRKVSEVARTTEATGRDKGAEVSDAARQKPAGPPASVPAGPPTSVPAGPPTSVPAGPPAAVPQGPDDTPAVTAPGRGGAPGHGG